MPFVEKLKILSIHMLTASCADILLEPGEIGRTAKPGQFVHVTCGEGNLLRRPISICNTEDNRLRLVVDMRGKGTKWLVNRQPGDTLDILGPLGNGFSSLDADETLIVAGGGIGVPPLLFAAKSHKGKTIAALGFHDKDRTVLIDDFKSVCDSVIICTDDGSLGKKGFVASVLPEAVQDGKPDMVMACGPALMLKSVADWAEKADISCEVSMEERMGCGVGACLVCACEMNNGKFGHVCKDGPVFKSGEVRL